MIYFQLILQKDLLPYKCVRNLLFSCQQKVKGQWSTEVGGFPSFKPFNVP